MQNRNESTGNLGTYQTAEALLTAQSFVGESSLEIAELNSKRKSVQELWKEGKAKLKTNEKSKRNVLDFE